MKKRSSRLGLYIAIALVSIVVIFVHILIFIAVNLGVHAYDVIGPAMEPSLHNGERVMVDKIDYMFHAPARGDVIVFVAPPAHGDNYIKRIIGIPGDVITVNNNTVILDGTTLNETYVNPALQGNANPPIVNEVIPPNNYFVMGDGRQYSSDSRTWGFVPRANIIGRAALVYWPPNQDNSGFLPNVSSVFAHVHQPTNRATLLRQATVWAR